MSVEHWDVIVVGAGIAGASAAYEMAPLASVLLLDMEDTLGHHATGRSAAMFLETYGGTDIRALTVASRTFLEAAPAEFESELLRPRPLLQMARPGRAGAVEQLYRDVAPLVPGVALLEEAESRDLCPMIRPGAVERCLYEPSAMEMDVDALHQGYVRGFRARGGSVRRGCRVTELSRSTTGWTVHLGDGSTATASRVVDAAGAWADHVASSAGVRTVGLTPRLRSAFTTAAPEGVVIANVPMLYDIDESFYVKPEGDQMLGSPADTTATDPVDAKPDMVEIARALDEIRRVTTIPAKSVRASWAGLRTFSPDQNLVVGPDPEADGFFWLAGQAGYGVQTAPALARFAAASVLGENVDTEVLALGLDPARIAPARFRVRRSGS